MKTVKDVSEITGISIRTLRYYDEIGLLKPTQLTKTGYRLYDKEALARLQEIIFFKELEIPLSDIKVILENPNYNRKQALLTQKSLLEQKRNHINRTIELIENVIDRVDNMNFELLNDEEVKRIVDHSINLIESNTLEKIAEQFVSIETYRNLLEKNLKDEKMSSHLIKMYGSKDKALEAMLQETDNRACFEKQQIEIDKIYKQFSLAKQRNDADLAQNAVKRLSESYKKMFKIDNARYLLLKVAKDYLDNSNPVLIKATDKQYGDGITQYIGHVIQYYYGA
ncbi:MAG: MerR family transcriptional regulator [Intestinibacter sp.]|uniref:MerR family transcriptional regulator n=1 Tax=Intestinibacter sp. TaxID=1965304 RepID=UPI003F18382F